MSVTVTRPDGEEDEFNDGDGAPGTTAVYSYELHPSAALLIHVDRSADTGESVHNITRLYGPAGWWSVEGDEFSARSEIFAMYE